MAALREEGLTRMIGVAPGPANGFTLDLIDCFEHFGSVLDWAMIILGPLEPWPGELCLDAASRADIKVITRVVDYGGLLFDDLLPSHQFAPGDHRGFRPRGWVQEGRRRIEAMRPISERTGLTMLQLACQWNLSHEAVECVAPTLIQETGSHARLVEDKRAELAALPREIRLSPDDVEAIRSWATTPAAWRSKAPTPTIPASSDPTAGRWTPGSRRSRAGGGSHPSGI